MDDDHQLRQWNVGGSCGRLLEDVIDAFVHWCVGSDGVIRGDCARAMMEAYRTLAGKRNQAGGDRAVTSLWRRASGGCHARPPAVAAGFCVVFAGAG